MIYQISSKMIYQVNMKCHASRHRQHLFSFWYVFTKKNIFLLRAYLSIDSAVLSSAERETGSKPESSGAEI